MPKKPSDYIGLLVSINNTAPFIDEKFSDELGVVINHVGPRVEQIEHARLAWGEDHFNNYNHLYVVLTTDGGTIKLFSDEFTIIGEKNNGKIRKKVSEQIGKRAKEGTK